MSGPDRRTFVKRAAAAAAASLLPTVGAPGVAAALAPPTWHRSPCLLCGLRCGLRVGVEGGRAVVARPDPDASPNRGLACVKGYHAMQTLYGPDRLSRALVRRGGRLVETPLPEALDAVAEALARTVSTHGAGAVAVAGGDRCSLEVEHLSRRLFSGGLGSPHAAAERDLDGAGSRLGALLSTGLPGPLGTLDDVDAADDVVLWDANLAETHPVLFSRLLERRRTDAHVRIVHLGPRATRTTYAADRGLPMAPGSEMVVANALAGEIVRRGWIDEAFVAAHVSFREDGGASAAPAAVSREAYAAFLAPYTAEAAARASGMPLADVRWLASLYGDRSRRVLSFWGAEASRHARSTALANLLHNLHLLTGKVASPGQGPFPLATVGPADAPAPLLSVFDGLESGEVRFLWVQGWDPLVRLPALGRHRAAAGAAGRFLVVSDAYPTATTDAADVVLPAALWLEETGTWAGCGRRVQHGRVAVAPPGDATPVAVQVVEIARRIGLGERFAGGADAVVEDAAREALAAGGAPSLPDLRDGPGGAWPVGGEGGAVRWRCSTAHDPAADRARGRFDFYGHDDHRAWVWLRAHEPAPEAPDEAFPFWLTPGPVLEHTGSGTLTRRVPTLHRAVPRGWAELHPDDARALGVRDGETVRLVSRRGSLDVEARVGYRSQPSRGQVFVADFDEGRAVGALATGARDPLSGQPTFRCGVRIERRPGGGGR